jgi:hypothetical protein
MNCEEILCRCKSGKRIFLGQIIVHVTQASHTPHSHLTSGESHDRLIKTKYKYIFIYKYMYVYIFYARTTTRQSTTVCSIENSHMIMLFIESSSTQTRHITHAS